MTCVGVLQGILLSVIHYNQNTSATVQVTDYISQLLPNFGPQETNAVAAQYTGFGTYIFQVGAIECELSLSR
jgi:hypothetical protein